MSATIAHTRVFAALAAGDVPKISDIVNCERHRYVWAGPLSIKCQFGKIQIPPGFLSDGATGVPDADWFAFFAHDCLYAYPMVVLEDGTTRRLTKNECDRVYRWLLWRSGHWGRAIWRYAGLWIGGGKAWRRWRDRETANPALYMQERILPMAHCWQAQTRYTRDLVWIGEDGPKREKALADLAAVGWHGWPKSPA